MEEPIPETPSKETDRLSESCASRLSMALAVGISSGVLMGAGMTGWYPDPYQIDKKGRMVSFNAGVGHVMRGLRGPVMWSSIVCMTFSGVECAMESMRDEFNASTWVNSSVAGAVSGMVLGGMSKRFDVMASTALGLGGIMGLVEYNGQKAKQASPVEYKFSEGEEDKPVDTVAELKKMYPEFKHL